MSIPVEPGSTRWSELVQLGIEKTGAGNWFLGDAALEIAPMGKDHTNNRRNKFLAQYADEVGCSPGSLRIYRDVSSAYSEPRRLGSVAWSVHHALVACPELIRDGMTTTEARALAKARPEARSYSNGRSKQPPCATCGERPAQVGHDDCEPCWKSTYVPNPEHELTGFEIDPDADIIEGNECTGVFDMVRADMQDKMDSIQNTFNAFMHRDPGPVRAELTAMGKLLESLKA